MKNKLAVTPPTYLFLALILSILFHIFFPLFRVFYYPFNLLGIIIFALGMFIGGWSFSYFRKTKTTLDPNQRSTSLLTMGPYRLSRNPIYLGMFLNLLGVSVFLGSFTPLLFPIIFILMMNYNVIPYEEKRMSKIFKNRYLSYREEVRRWL